jgi:MerR family transcriptional regulator/heat shock protein HspR
MWSTHFSFLVGREVKMAMYVTANGLRRLYMVRKNTQVKPLKKDLPVYPISVAARLLNLHPRTLRIYEDEGLIKPDRVGNRRLYSANDITWVGCLRKMIHDEGISIPGIKKLLRFATCYEIADCPDRISCSCDAVVDRVIPRGLRLAGDDAGSRETREKEMAVRSSERKSGKGLGKAAPKKRDRKID